MKIAKTNKFVKKYQRLHPDIRKKVDKQIQILSENLFHPGLNAKKEQGIDRWEARVDKHYRLTFGKTDDMIILRTVGPHDEGLGKK